MGKSILPPLKTVLPPRTLKDIQFDLWAREMEREANLREKNMGQQKLLESPKNG